MNIIMPMPMAMAIVTITIIHGKSGIRGAVIASNNSKYKKVLQQ